MRRRVTGLLAGLMALFPAGEAVAGHFHLRVEGPASAVVEIGCTGTDARAPVERHIAAGETLTLEMPRLVCRLSLARGAGPVAVTVASARGNRTRLGLSSGGSARLVMD